jgi:hypothetical protein
MGIDDLDSLLNFLYNKKYKYVLFEDVIKEHFGGDRENNDVEGLIVKLDKDGLLDTEWHKDPGRKFGLTEQGAYKLSYDGILFKENGGYQAKDKRDKLEMENIRTDLRIRKRNDRLLMLGAIGAAIGALGLVGWEIFKYFCLEQH